MRSAKRKASDHGPNAGNRLPVLVHELGNPLPERALIPLPQRTEAERMDFRTHSMSGETLEWKGVISMYCHCKGCVTSCCIPCQQIGTVTGPTGPTGATGLPGPAGSDGRNRGDGLRPARQVPREKPDFRDPRDPRALTDFPAPTGPAGEAGLPGPTGATGASGSTGGNRRYGAHGCGRDGGTHRPHRRDRGYRGRRALRGRPGAWAQTPMSCFVQADAAPGGDGSQAAPFQTIQQALAAAPPDSVIHVLRGTYPISQQLVISTPRTDHSGPGRGHDPAAGLRWCRFYATAATTRSTGLTMTSNAPYPVEFIQIGGDGNQISKLPDLWFCPCRAIPRHGW